MAQVFSPLPLAAPSLRKLIERACALIVNERVERRASSGACEGPPTRHQVCAPRASNLIGTRWLGGRRCLLARWRRRRQCSQCVALVTSTRLEHKQQGARPSDAALGQYWRANKLAGGARQLSPARSKLVNMNWRSYLHQINLHAPPAGASRGELKCLAELRAPAGRFAR